MIDKWNIKYSTDEDQKHKVSKDFESVNFVGFQNCSGCIAGLLIWILKASLKKVNKAGTGRIFVVEKANLMIAKQ